MSDYYTLLTNAGIAYETACKAAGVPIKLSQISVGDGNGAVYNPAATATALKREVWRGPLNALFQDDKNPSWLLAEVTIPPEVGGWYVREAGIWTDTGILYAIIKYPESFKPVLATSGSGKEFYIRSIFETSNASQVTLLIDDNIVKATRAWVASYVADELAKRDSKRSVRVVATSNIVLSGAQQIDSVAVVVGDRVLVTKQTAGKDNGLYVVAAGAWVRASDADNSLEVTPGLFVGVEEGSVSGDSVWQLVTDAPIVLGTTALIFEVVAGRTGVVAGTYRSLTVDKIGRVIGGTNPNTLAGAGITDAYTKPETVSAIQQAITSLIDSSPAALDTLKELAVALGNDPNFATTMTNALAGKADKSQLGTAAALTATTSPTDGTVGRVLRVGDFGLGGVGAATLSDANSIEASGIYSIIGATLNVPAGAGSGSMLFHMNHLIAAGNRTATQEIITRSIVARKFWRARVNDVWAPWVEAASSGVNSSITALTGLTARPSFGGYLAWDAGNFDPSSKINKDQSQAVGFFGGAKTAPYLLHADGTFVYLQVDRPKDTALLTVNGWSKNADNGEIVQRTEIAIGDATPSMTVPVTWPFQFPNKCFRAVVSFRTATGSPIGLIPGFYDLTTSGCTIKLEELNGAIQSGLVLMVEAVGY